MILETSWRPAVTVSCTWRLAWRSVSQAVAAVAAIATSISRPSTLSRKLIASHLFRDG